MHNLLVLKRRSGRKNNRKVICAKISTFIAKWITVTIKGRPVADELFDTQSDRHNINCSKNEKCIPLTQRTKFVFNENGKSGKGLIVGRNHGSSPNVPLIEINQA